MICSRCRKTALYHVGERGFCGDHRSDAQRAAKADADAQTSQARARVKDWRDMGNLRRTNLYRSGNWAHRGLDA